MGSLSGVQDQSDQPVGKDKSIAKSEVDGEASPYEMAAMGEEGMATESVEIPSNQIDNNALLTDMSIQDQSEALAQMKEAHKEDMKKAQEMEIEKKKVEEEKKKNDKANKQKEEKEDKEVSEYEKIMDPELQYFLA